ncbi:MAG TPA: hypothetical protein P5572_01695, partial [Phycisphaerae bacterium]|nr:hypothetical protein [Phycisphaerae bacterium]
RAKHSRTPDELKRALAAEMPAATAEDRDIAFANRVEQLRIQQLLIDQWDLDDINADLAWCGLAGSPTKVHRVQSIVLTKEGFTEVEATEAGVRRMIHELIVDHTLG